MTGPTLDLTRWQEETLAAISDGAPTKIVPRPDNLLRRGLLMSVPPHGAGLVKITEAGRDALRLARERRREEQAIEVCVYLNGSLIETLQAPPSYRLLLGEKLAADVSAFSAGLRRAVEDAEAIRDGRDPERPSEKAMRLADEATS